MDNGDSEKIDPRQRFQIQPNRDGNVGVLNVWIQLSVGMMETLTSATFGLLQDLRVEAKSRVSETLSWADGSSQGAFRMVRRGHDRLHHVADEALARSEYALLSLLRAVRHTGHDAAGVASDAMVSFVGEGKSVRKVAASG